MTDTKALREIIDASGLKYKSIAESLGITPFGLQNKIDNVTEFKSSEVKKMCNLLGINSLKKKEDIFFADKVDK